MQSFLFYAILIIYVTIAVLSGTKYFLLYPISGFFVRVEAIFIIVLFIISAKLIGRKILGLFSYEFKSKLEESVFEYGTGIGFYCIAMFLIGIVGLYHSSIAWLLIIIPLMICYKDLIALTRSLTKVKISNSQLPGILTILGFFLVGLTFIIVAITCFTPPTYYDSLVYHLALPEIYTQAKKIISVPFNLYSHFPQNMEMLYTLGLLIGNEMLPKLITFSLAAALTIGIYSFSKRFFDKSVGLISIVLFSTTTAVMLLAASSYVEIGIAFFSFIALYSYLISISPAENSGNKTKFLVLSAIFSGLAFGIKYTGIITPVIISLFILVKCIREKRPGQIKQILMYNCIVGLVFLPWAVKNIINVGNPVFPFFYNLVGYKNIPWNILSAERYFAMLTEYSFKSSLLQELFLFPWNIFVKPLKYGGGIDILGDFGWALYFLIIPAVLFLRKIYFPFKYLLGYSVLHFILWFITKPVLRFLFPLLPIFAIIAGYILVKVVDKRILLLKFIIPAGLVLFIVSHFYLYFYVQSIIEPFNVALGIETKENYLSRKIRFSPYPVFEYINTNLSSRDKILFIGEQRGFYCKRKYIATNVFAPNPFVEWSNRAKNYEELISKMKEYGFTHLFYNEREGERLKGYGIFDFNPRGEKNWEELKKNLVLQFSCNEVCLYRL